MVSEKMRALELDPFSSLMQQLGIERDVLLSKPGTVCIAGIGLSFGERALFGSYSAGVWLPHKNVRGIWACERFDYLGFISDPHYFAAHHGLGLPIISVPNFSTHVDKTAIMQLSHTDLTQACRAIHEPFFDIVTLCRVPNFCSGLLQLFSDTVLDRVVKPGGVFITTGGMSDPLEEVPNGWELQTKNLLRDDDLSLYPHWGVCISENEVGCYVIP